MSDNNTIAGWVLGAGIVALGGSILFGEIFHAEKPEAEGYAIESLEGPDGGAEAEKPIAAFMAAADAGKGEKIFAKCKACHTINAGGATGIGPNIHGIMGKPVAGGSFAYSEALKGVGGNWDWDQMSAWLKSPKKFAAGNKMSFPGLSKPEERADLLAYLNSQGSNLPLPEYTEEAAPEGEAGAEGDAKAAEGEAEGEVAPSLTPEQVAEDQVIDNAAEEKAAEEG